MTTITIPVTATQQEIRCDSLICRNALDISEDNPLNKYSVILDRLAEPQDAEGNRVGDRMRLASRTVPMGEIFAATVTVDGILLTGAQVMTAVNAIVDQFKANDLQESTND